MVLILRGGSNVSNVQREDVVLIERVRQGDQHAFEALYDRYADLVFSLAVRMLGYETAEEVVQEVFLTLWRKADRFEPERGSLSTWLLTVTRHRAIDEIRHRRRRQGQNSPSLDLSILKIIPDKAPGPEERAQSETQSIIVANALSEIPPEQREVILLAYFEGLTQSQIASQLDLPLGTVKKRVRLGLQKLKRSLTEEGVIQL